MRNTTALSAIYGLSLGILGGIGRGEAGLGGAGCRGGDGGFGRDGPGNGGIDGFIGCAITCPSPSMQLSPPHGGSSVQPLPSRACPLRRRPARRPTLI